MNAYVLSKVDIRMFITAIIYNSQNLETTQCLSTEERINYGTYIYELLMYTTIDILLDILDILDFLMHFKKHYLE